MGYRKLHFAVSAIVSVTVVSVLIFTLMSTQLAMAALPLTDVVGIGGLYLNADSFTGKNAQVYPVKGTGIDGPSEPVDADTPVCKQRPMLAITLNDANVQGFEVRKDLKLPHLAERWMTIELDQPFGSIDANNITFYTTQLEVDTLTLRNVLIREGRPEEGGQDPAIAPRNQDLTEITNKKWGPYSGEFYLEGGNTTENGPPGLKATDAQAWLHAITARSVTLKKGTGLFALEVDVSFPTDSQVRNDYENELNNFRGTLGYVGPESGGKQRDEGGYFDCIPVEAQ